MKIKLYGSSGRKLLVGSFLLMVGSTGCRPPKSAVFPDGETVEQKQCPADRIIYRQALSGNGDQENFCKAPAIAGRGGTWASKTVLAVPGKRYAYCGYLWQPLVPERPAGQAPVDPKLGAPPLPLPPVRAEDLAPPDLQMVRRALTSVGIKAQDIEVDCAVMNSTAPPTPMPPARWRPMQNNFQLQASQVTTWPAGARGVQVAVIDSAVLGYSITGDTERYPHGRTVGRVIADLACPDPYRCGVQNYLALPHTAPHTVDLQHGGFFGTRGELAEQIARALDAFAPSMNQEHLVVNLSLGWDAAFDKKYPGPIGRDSVHDALTRAACMGALTIAASGNRSIYQDSPSLPAAWEVHDAPDQKTCLSLGFPWRSFKQVGKYRPLVFAASGVNGHDIPLAITRPDGQSRLVAYAKNVITDDKRATPHTALMTGSSMAAAVVSGVAAAGWSFAPDHDQYAVMDLVYDTAVPLDPAQTGGATTDFCNGPSCAAYPLRRVSACNTIKALAPGVECNTLAAHKGVDVEQAEPDLVAGSSSPPAAQGGATPPALTPCLGANCGGPGGPQPPQPWVAPQPAWPTCVPCQLSKLAANHPLTTILDPRGAPPSGTIQWAQVYTDTQGFAGSPIWIGADRSAWFFIVNTVASPNRWAMVTYYRFYSDGITSFSGWGDWQELSLVP